MILIYDYKTIVFNFLKSKNTIISIILVLLLIISNTVCSAVGLIVNKIHFNGLQRMSLETALFNLPFTIGSLVDESILSDGIRKLFDTGYFEEIALSNSDDGIITITVKERPMINALILNGNKIIKTEIIQDILNTKKIKSGELLNNYTIFEAQQELEDICYSFGKFNSTIKIFCNPLERNRVDIKVIFSEGKTAKVNSISIFGNHDFTQKQLLKQFKSYNCTRWNNIIFHKQYHKQRLFNDLEILRTFYLNHGYAKFDIDDTKINLDSNKENVYCSVFITEGSKYLFKSLIIRGNVLNHIPEIKNCLFIPDGEVYSRIRIKEIENNIRYILGKYGYIHPSVSMEYDFDDCNKTIKLYVYIDVGNRFYVHEIRFEGNDITQDSVIRREIQQMEQTPLNYISILRDQERLRRFSYCKQVETRIANVPDLFNQVDLIYTIEERNTGNLNVSMGIGAESGLNMQIGICQDNLFGTGNATAITAIKNRHQTYVDISVFKKYFGIKRNSISGKIFYNNLLNYKTDLSNYNMKNYGIDINYQYPITEYETYNIGLNYTSHNLNQITPQIAIWRYLNSIDIDPSLLITDKPLNKGIRFYVNDLILVSGWVFNNVNCMYFPEFGSRFGITGYLTLPGFDNKYYKIIIDSSYYLPLDNRSEWIFLNSMYFGYASGFYKKIESPFYDNFYIGGIGTIRGFRPNSIGPKAVYYDCSDSNINYDTCSIKNSQDTIGGNAVTFIRNELILPIAFFVNNPKYFDTTRISLFMDIGTVWDTYWKNTEATRAAGILDYSIFGHIRISTGVSLKWISPMGPVMFSYSKVFKKYPGDIEEPFQFSIGKIW